MGTGLYIIDLLQYMHFKIGVFEMAITVIVKFTIHDFHGNESFGILKFISKFVHEMK